MHVQDVIALNFQLELGSVAESVTVEGGSPMIETADGSVSTVVDRNFAENLPMNGRSFQTLIQLTPGVVVAPTNVRDGGQFSINGQRAASNYWMVDGVGANIGIGVNANGNPGNGLAGAANSFSALGGTNSLVSVDAMQEFRIQTVRGHVEHHRAELVERDEHGRVVQSTTARVTGAPGDRVRGAHSRSPVGGRAPPSRARPP